MSEDARRTGDWDWVLDEINAVMTLHPEGNDTVPLRLARQALAAFRGEPDEAEMATLARALEVISDPDIGIELPGHSSQRSHTRRAVGRRRRRSGRRRRR